MTDRIDRLADVATRFDAVVLDQWGVLHDGTAPYPGALAALDRLRAAGVRLAVLSNSGKRAAPNLDRIAGMGFAPTLFETVMTSGEALWQEVHDGHVPARNFYTIARTQGDAAGWAKELDIALVDDLAQAEALLLMGLPDDADQAMMDEMLQAALAADMPLYCTNPDRASPRAGGVTVTSPGALAHAYQDAGGTVRFYGKPHRPVFEAIERVLEVTPDRLLMVGDSLEHDIAGGANAGWATAFIEGGLHRAAFQGTNAPLSVLNDLAAAEGTDLPTFSLSTLE